MLHFVVCVAGLPRDVYAEFCRVPEPKIVESLGSRVCYPMREVLRYQDGMSQRYLNSISSYIGNVPAKDDVGVLLVYANYPGQQTAAFLNDFAPFAIAAPYDPIYSSAWPKKRFRENMKNSIELIVDVIEGLRSRPRIVRDEFSGEPLHPLLMPRRNFRSNVLGPILQDLFQSIGVCEDVRAALIASRETVSKAHPVNLLGEGKKKTKYMVDNRRLKFKSPGRDRHGMAMEHAAHRADCLVNSRVRFGGPFDALLHFDCESDSGLNRTYPNCHDANIAPFAKTHVNIAPNDAIR